MSRLDKIIAFLLVSITAGCAWLLSQSATVTLGVAFSAWALLSMLFGLPGLKTERASEVVQRAQPSKPSGLAVSIVALVLRVIWPSTGALVLLGLFVRPLTEWWSNSAKLVAIAVGFGTILEMLLSGLTRRGSARRGA